MAKLVLGGLVSVVALEAMGALCLVGLVLAVLAVAVLAVLAAVVLAVVVAVAVVGVVLAMTAAPAAVLCWAVWNRLQQRQRPAQRAVEVPVQVEAVAPAAVVAQVEAVPVVEEPVAVPAGWGVIRCDWTSEEMASDKPGKAPRKAKGKRSAPKPAADLSALTKPQLLALAAERGVAVASRWTKARLVEALTVPAAA
jgi:hypothetical protein